MTTGYAGSLGGMEPIFIVRTGFANLKVCEHPRAPSPLSWRCTHHPIARRPPVLPQLRSMSSVIPGWPCRSLALTFPHLPRPPLPRLCSHLPEKRH